MTTDIYLEAQSIMDRIDSIDQAIEYMETVKCSTECYNAIIDMLKYDRESFVEQFRKL